MDRRAFVTTLGALAVAGCSTGGNANRTGKTAATAAAGGQGVRLPGTPDDAGVLAFALRLEQLQLDLYRRAQDAAFFEGAETQLIQALAEQEAAHVDKLTAELKRLKVRPGAAAALRAPLTDRRTVLATAYRLENLTASAYLGQVARIRDQRALETVLSIQTVEGRHAAAVGALLGKTATPDGAVAVGHDMATIDQVVGELAT